MRRFGIWASISLGIMAVGVSLTVSSDPKIITSAGTSDVFPKRRPPYLSSLKGKIPRYCGLRNNLNPAAQRFTQNYDRKPAPILNTRSKTDHEMTGGVPTG
ncbi:hypothetical protein C8R47DRAFT_41056 [Mycena vitilis]|nr:hypothetical protein C8R47DRAFT_41056 [Mycena vitilis]